MKIRAKSRDCNFDEVIDDIFDTFEKALDNLPAINDGTLHEMIVDDLQDMWDLPLEQALQTTEEIKNSIAQAMWDGYSQALETASTDYWEDD